MKLVPSFFLFCLQVQHVTSRPTYLNQIPNGNLFPNERLGHDAHELNDFGRAFQENGRRWTQKVCQTKLKGVTMGEKLGDPCCVWEIGARPQVTDKAQLPAGKCAAPGGATQENREETIQVQSFAAPSPHMNREETIQVQSFAAPSPHMKCP